jgi:magnesium chelatase family protein
VRYKELADRSCGEASDAIRERVNRARDVQRDRLQDRPIFCNAQMTPRDSRRHCALADGADQRLETAMTTLCLSARAYTRILKVAGTIATPIRPTPSRARKSPRRFSTGVWIGRFKLIAVISCSG